MDSSSTSFSVPVRRISIAAKDAIVRSDQTWIADKHGESTEQGQVVRRRAQDLRSWPYHSIGCHKELFDTKEKGKPWHFDVSAFPKRSVEYW